jgi:NADH:ubiquinone oxidoreductase subunit 3 (subunit A)
MLLDYFFVLLLICSALFVIALVLGLSYFLSARYADPERVSAYECGFNPFDDARSRFDVQFYLVSILFIVFDLEVSFLFPWSVCFNDLDSVAFWSMILFLVILTVGFLYEWWRGALDWE